MTGSAEIALEYVVDELIEKQQSRAEDGLQPHEDLVVHLASGTVLRGRLDKLPPFAGRTPTLTLYRRVDATSQAPLDPTDRGDAADTLVASCPVWFLLSSVEAIEWADCSGTA